MDDPEYIVLVALDTPSRSTGIYISGGVMAAPTVGAVMADILPYLSVKQQFPEGDVAGKTVIMDNLVGLSLEETKKWLKAQGLTAKVVGTGDTVTGQIPAAGEMVPGGSEVLLYLGEEPPDRMVTVPDFFGMNRQKASDEAGKLGIYIQVMGNDKVEPSVTVTAQDIPAGTQVPLGTTIKLTFTDIKAAD
jgi:stage V sporulation protein D (sporulation-specific penicillin-binding protein)